MEFLTLVVTLHGCNANHVRDVTPLTRLPNDVYSKLESAVANAVKLQRAKDPNDVLSLLQSYI